MKYLLLSLILISLAGLVIPSAFAENVPSWVKNTAGWWADDKISETEFVNAIEFLVKENIIQVDASQTSETSQSVPAWVKNTAGWWTTDAISETEFVNAIAYLIKVGIISIESDKSPELIAEMWVNGDIDDNEFLANVEQLIENDIITIQSNSITKTSQLPDWLVNNAGWWAARILTNSDFEFNPGYVKEEIFACEENSRSEECFKKTFNSLGLRGDEIKKEKPDNTFRIFAVGGSTTFGHAALDSETWPALLQQIIDEKITGKKIEVINAGISGGTSESEYNLIKNKLLSFDPDLIIMYDGWNDHRLLPVETTIHSWKSICKLGKNEGFDTTIVIQPLPLTGQRVLTEQEIENSFTPVIQIEKLHKFQRYVDAFEELDEVCTKTADFRRIFDYIQEPVFFDGGHTTVFGKKIIAENVFSVISPIYFDETYSVIQHDLNSVVISEHSTDAVYAVGADFSNRNFDNLNLQNAVFDKADLSNTSFKNTNIDGARFVFANLDNSNLLDRIDLSDINLAGANLKGANVSLKGKDISGTILTGADLSNSNLTGVDLSGKDLTATILTGADLSNSNLTGANLTGANLKGANVKNVDFTSADLTNAKFRGVDISMGYLSTMNLTKADLSGAILTNADLAGIDLTKADLSGQDLSDKDLTNTILWAADLTNAILPDGVLSGNNFEWTKFNGVDLSGKDLSHSNFQYATFDNANLEGAKLSQTSFIQADFTKIKNKSLAGTDLTEASFAHSNLSGVDLSDTLLKAPNFWKTNLSGVDFTVVGSITDGAVFIEAILPNSNFEGVDLSPQILHSDVFNNKAHLYGLHHDVITKELVGDVISSHMLMNKWAVHGNGLAVEYFFYNSFASANLENANFKNADLRITSFASANLTNADLSGADLSNANLDGADLSNANLDGADLQDALLDNVILTGANLRCINHPICN